MADLSGGEKRSAGVAEFHVARHAQLEKKKARTQPAKVRGKVEKKRSREAERAKEKGVKCQEDLEISTRISGRLRSTCST
jgi:hypothetical protein